MSLRCSDSNIQEKLKASNASASIELEAQIAALAALLRSRRFPGEVMRTLARRLRHSYSKEPYTSKELQALLALTVALERAGMWP